MKHQGMLNRWRQSCFAILIVAAVMVAMPVTGWGSQQTPSQEAPAIDLRPVVRGIERPTVISHANDGSGWLFIGTRTGKIRIYDGDRLRSSPFLDISERVACCEGEQGLLGLTFHPQYRENGYFYLYYTDTSGDVTLARYRVSEDPQTADPDSAQTLLTVDQQSSRHQAGQLQFGPDGYLYVGVGFDANRSNAQDLSSLKGKILRIDVDRGSPYAIPPDNPFTDNPEARAEVWVYGLRNPWRFSFDRETGDLFIGDVGAFKWEELDVQPSNSSGGENYGFPNMEGRHCFQPAEGCRKDEFVSPIFEHSHQSGNCSIIAGYRYRGERSPELQGTLFYSDWCSGVIWGAWRNDNGAWTHQRLLDLEFGMIQTFGEGEEGEVYVATVNQEDYQGRIFRIAQAPGPPKAPAKLETTALSPSEVKLQWQDNSANEVGFQIERKPHGAKRFDLVGLTEPSVTRFTDRGLTRDFEYVYRIQAINAAGGSPYAWGSVTTLRESQDPQRVAPEAPSNLSVEIASRSGRLLRWKDNSENERAFTIERRRESGEFELLFTVDRNVTQYVDDEDVSDGTALSYRVRAANGQGFSDYSNTVSVSLERPSQSDPRDLSQKSNQLSELETQIDELRNDLQVHMSVTSQSNPFSWSIARWIVLGAVLVLAGGILMLLGRGRS